MIAALFIFERFVLSAATGFNLAEGEDLDDFLDFGRFRVEDVVDELGEVAHQVEISLESVSSFLDLLLDELGGRLEHFVEASDASDVVSDFFLRGVLGHEVCLDEVVITAHASQDVRRVVHSVGLLV